MLEAHHPGEVAPEHRAERPEDRRAERVQHRLQAVHRRMQRIRDTHQPGADQRRAEIEREPRAHALAEDDPRRDHRHDRLHLLQHDRRHEVGADDERLREEDRRDRRGAGADHDRREHVAPAEAEDGRERAGQRTAACRGRAPGARRRRSSRRRSTARAAAGSRRPFPRAPRRPRRTRSPSSVAAAARSSAQVNGRTMRGRASRPARSRRQPAGDRRPRAAAASPRESGSRRPGVRSVAYLTNGYAATSAIDTSSPSRKSRPSSSASNRSWCSSSRAAARSIRASSTSDRGCARRRRRVGASRRGRATRGTPPPRRDAAGSSGQSVGSTRRTIASEPTTISPSISATGTRFWPLTSRTAARSTTSTSIHSSSVPARPAASATRSQLVEYGMRQTRTSARG